MDVSRALREVYGEDIEPSRVDALKRDASNRSYHRIHLPGRAPPTLVVMELAGDPRKSEEGMRGPAPTELPFLNVGRFLALRGVPVPAVHAVDLDAGVLLLEDLGDETFERRLLALGPDLWDEPYEAAVDLLVRFQAVTADPDPRCIGYGRAFDEALLRWELDHFREWGLEAVHGTLSPAARAELDAELDALAARVAVLPRRLAHRDWQSRNLVWTARGLVVLDFQDALLGPRVYDLVALLGDSYVDVRPPLRDRMIARFAASTGAVGDEVKAEFHLVAVQRKLKDAGRFVFIDRVKKNPSFLPHVPHSLELVRRSLRADPSLAPLAAILADIVPALAD